jgi:acetyltransferase-like isoleucine patch superfamily enzyme
MSEPRTIAWDWYPGTIPINAVVDETAYVETTYSFHLFNSERTEGLRIGRGASTYLGTMFDVGPRGRVSVGEFALVHGARIVCDAEIEIGDYALISWNVVLMDTRRVPADPRARRRALERAALHPDRRLDGEEVAIPIRIGRNVWIGFDACVLPGVTIGEGSIVGARSVVVESVAPYTVVAGNPARVIRQLTAEGNNQ